MEQQKYIGKLERVVIDSGVNSYLWIGLAYFIIGGTAIIISPLFFTVGILIILLTTLIYYIINREVEWKVRRY